jgi:hypothetical protein
MHVSPTLSASRAAISNHSAFWSTEGGGTGRKDLAASTKTPGRRQRRQARRRFRCAHRSSFRRRSAGPSRRDSRSRRRRWAGGRGGGRGRLARPMLRGCLRVRGRWDGRREGGRTLGLPKTKINDQTDKKQARDSYSGWPSSFGKLCLVPAHTSDPARAVRLNVWMRANIAFELDDYLYGRLLARMLRQRIERTSYRAAACKRELGHIAPFQGVRVRICI